MKKFSFIVMILFLSGLFYQPVAATPAKPAPKSASVKPWQSKTPKDYTPITWVKARGIASFVKAQEGNGFNDYLTVIHLPSTQVKFISSSTPKMEWGPGNAPLDAEDFRNWAFARLAVERSKASFPDVRFIWDFPFFNITIPITDLSLSLKSRAATSTYATSGSRPEDDIAKSRRVLMIDNKAGKATVAPFDFAFFVDKKIDQIVEGFDPLTLPKGSASSTARLYVGVKPGGSELVVYCSRGASAGEASAALLIAGVPLENQVQGDGGGSTTCGYNLPGQYFVEPGRMLPGLMGAFSLIHRGTVTINDLNVRMGPAKKFAVVSRLLKGAPVEVYEEKNGWWRISEAQEWVLGSLVKKK